jgi:transcription elongation factor Elf1
MPDEEMVPEIWACPCCGERRMDFLEHHVDEEKVTCATCGTTYEIDSDA